MHSVRSILVIIALGSTLLGSNAQVTTSCNPLEGVCANDKGLASSSYSIDFTSVKTLPSEWIVADNEKVTLGADGAELSFTQRFDAPTIRTDFNIFFGRVEYVVKAAPGTGIISSMVLLSDDLDEVDWEFRGGVTDSVQTNYFGKGYTGTYNRSTTEPVTSPQATFHTYALDWSPTALVWSIDGKIMRTLNAANADGNGSQYPQTPMKISLSLWDGGDPDTNPGTVQWAGGLTPLPPAQPYTMYVKSVKVWNSNPGKMYKYSDKSGSWKSIRVINETIASNSSVSAQNTSTLSLAPTAPISTGAPFANMTGSGAPFPNTTHYGAPFANTTRSCSTTSTVSHKSNGTAMTTSSPTSLVTSLGSSMQSPGYSTLKSTTTCSKTSSSSSLAVIQSTKPTGSATAAPIPSTPASGVISSSLGTPSPVSSAASLSQPTASYQMSQSAAVPSDASLSPPTTPTTSSSSSEAAPQTYTQSPSTSPIGKSTLAQAATPSVPCTCTASHQETPIVSSSGTPYTPMSPSITAAASNAPSPAVTPVGGPSDGAYTKSPVDSATPTITSPSPTGSQFTNTDDGDKITDMPDNPDSVTDTIEDDTTTTTSTTRTTSVTMFITSTGTAASIGTGATAKPTGAPYPYTNGSYVPASGSLARTGASAGSLSGYAKPTKYPLPYSLGAGSRVRVGSSMAVVAGTMAGFWFLL
ncbi:MAG: hypothetical protein HETSPECPRED_004125 [Heterodermia speciosa]|uniref:chitinase n=1 Tax=Heterodermia speciosa TaxID=116794 RepID=A0A8H3IN53_9LECA|nr:MAG: hypothetical protein HETSPECPRED_004125 [Heterodermia speciosa]